MTKAQMATRIAELEKEVEALKAAGSGVTHIHYHYPQQPLYYQWQTPFYVSNGNNSADSFPITWTVAT